MISFEEAFDIVMESARPLGTETVPISDALNRILAQDVTSDMDMPPFNKSAPNSPLSRRSLQGTCPSDRWGRTSARRS